MLWSEIARNVPGNAIEPRERISFLRDVLDSGIGTIKGVARGLNRRMCVSEKTVQLGIEGVLLAFNEGLEGLLVSHPTFFE